jgi:hypothetical protein
MTAALTALATSLLAMWILVAWLCASGAIGLVAVVVLIWLCQRQQGTRHLTDEECGR